MKSNEGPTVEVVDAELDNISIVVGLVVRNKSWILLVVFGCCSSLIVIAGGEADDDDEVEGLILVDVCKRPRLTVGGGVGRL